MPGRSQRRVAFILVGGILLTGVIVLAFRSWRVTRAVAVIESCGGAISADELWPYIWGSHLVTFDLPGLTPIVKDSDGPRLARAFANLPRLERLILASNSLGDEFFTAIAPSVSIESIQSL